MRVVNADALAMKLRHMGYMDENEEIQEVIDRFAEERDGDSISREYLKEHVEACWINGRPRHAPELNELLSWIDDVPSAEPQVTVFCNLKDCGLNRNGVCAAECIIVEEDLGRIVCLNYDRKESR